VLELLGLPSGELVAGGTFVAAGAATARGVARCDATGWQATTVGCDGTVQALELAPDGSLLAGGNFTHIGGTTAFFAARYDGSAWAPLGGGPQTGVAGIVGAANGDVFVATGLSGVVRRWNGST
jgi:hypothetical protein